MFSSPSADADVRQPLQADEPIVNGFAVDGFAVEMEPVVLAPSTDLTSSDEPDCGEITVPKVERVSLSNEGEEVLGFAASASLSGDGRFVAFSDTANDLVIDDTNPESDIFVRDRLLGLTERISFPSDFAIDAGMDSAGADSAGVDSAVDGSEIAYPSYNPAISENGRYVAFQTQFAETSQVFVYDRDTDFAEVVSAVPAFGEPDEVSEVGNGAATNADISADGRFVVFQSEADNLGGDDELDDTNGVSDIFVRDRQLNTLERISVAIDTTQANAASSQADISADGRYIAFASDASNLVENDTNGTADIFVYDRETQRIERVSLASDGAESNGFSRAPSISADGRYISYDSLATNLVAGDTNQKGDVFLFDRLTQATTRVSVSSEGEQSNNFSFNHGMSADGRYISYSSVATNLVDNDTNRVSDVFVFDRDNQTTTRLSVSAEGTQGNRESRESVLSADGRFVAFQSSADGLVDDDTNGRTDIFVAELNPPQVPELPVAQGASENIIDLTEMETPTVMASIAVMRSAGYDNTVGWYVVEDAQGGVEDALTGEVLMPGDVGYAKAAIAQRLDVNLTGVNHEVVSYELEMATGGFLATFIVSNGTVESLLDADTLNDPNIFFGHVGANSDGTEHVQLLEENTFGYEDLLGGGDRDFNDMTVKVTFV
ncbi:MAG: DUF4114 domain-containing protein [Phormidesmis sp.]